jgi:polysaccharide pyruvyl transferase WcaK-like protein
MRIIIDQVVYDMRNKGNVALLQVALERIHNFWPEASLEVLTLSPHLLKLYWPAAQPVEPDGLSDWQMNRGRNELLHKIVPKSIWRLMFELREEVWRHRSPRSPNLVFSNQSIVNSKYSKYELADEETDEKKPYKKYSVLVDSADLFIVSGAQHMSDAVYTPAIKALDRLEAAIKQDIPTAMVSQGIGPIKEPTLTARAKYVLPKVNMIFVRDNTYSPQLLTSLGVDSSHIYMTGDDAIEMAYEARINQIGNGIGVGWRVAPYTEVDDHHLEIVHMVLTQLTQKYHAKLIAVPISHSAHELDDQFIQQLILKRSEPWHWQTRFDTPIEIIRRVGKCRLVVTGTFHAAVFALAQGIPAIGLAKSEMYLEKFVGLKAQFGLGIQIINLDDNQLHESLETAIIAAWDSAEQIKPQLLETARIQIQRAHSAYRQLYQMVESRKTRTNNNFSE